MYTIAALLRLQGLCYNTVHPWNPHYHGNKEKIEHVQRRFMKYTGALILYLRRGSMLK